MSHHPVVIAFDQLSRTPEEVRRRRRRPRRSDSVSARPTRRR